jgi:hypothetical protein
MRTLKGWLALAALVLASGCGGGGGDPGASPFGGGSSGGDGGGTTPKAADITLALDSANVPNSGSQTVKATVTAVDASRNTLQGIPVSISVDNNAFATVGGNETSADGTVTATVSIGADRSNRIITVRAVSGSIERTASFQVIGAKLDATVVPSVTTPGSAGNKVQYRLTDVNSNAMPGQSIVVTAPGLPDVTGTTDTNGSFEYVYTAPQTTGDLTVNATAGGATRISTVLIQPSGGGSVQPAVGPILSPSVSANPSVVSVNTDQTSNRSEIRALFLGTNNAPIKNVRVRFDLPDPSSVGGAMSTGSSIVYSDANGIATTAYVPGTRSSPTNGVIVKACYSTDDFAAGTCPNSVQTTLTVVSEALAVTIGTDNTISTGTGGLTYVKKFVVLVVDSSGQAKPDVQLAASIDLLRYIKGWYDGPGAWNRDGFRLGSSAVPKPGNGIGYTGATCLNEDINRNGVLESGEDINGSAQLDPRKSDVAISFVGASKTGANGTAIVQIEYPRNVATWIDFKILISASGVSGTEGRTNWFGTLPALAADFTADTAPPFVVSPYGTGDWVNDTGDAAVDCQNPD